MKVLFVGLGSIGKRNLESCLRLRPDYEYAALRRPNSSSFGNHHVREFTQLTEVDAFRPDLVYVCNPTSMHAATVLQLEKFKPAFFIEKPLAHTLADVIQICDYFEAQKKPFFYGCLLRLHPLIARVKELIVGGSLGKPLSYTLFCGSYLPDWRPGRDYRTTYSAKMSMGGGVTLDVVHEFDFAEFWFGPMKELSGKKAHVSDLEIDSDDLSRTDTRHKNGVHGKIELNYFRREPKRDFEIVLSEGLISGDLITGQLIFEKRKGMKTQESHSISRDDLHDRQTRKIFETLEGKDNYAWDISLVRDLMLKVLAIPFADSKTVGVT